MLTIRPPHKDLKKYLKKHNLAEKFQKQFYLFTNNPYHPSLHTERLEPRSLKLFFLSLRPKIQGNFCFCQTTRSGNRGYQRSLPLRFNYSHCRHFFRLPQRTIGVSYLFKILNIKGGAQNLFFIIKAFGQNYSVRTND